MREESVVIDALCALRPTRLLTSGNPAIETICCDEQAELVLLCSNPRLIAVLQSVNQGQERSSEVLCQHTASCATCILNQFRVHSIRGSHITGRDMILVLAARHPLRPSASTTNVDKGCPSRSRHAVFTKLGDGSV
jgi:hypothetical protein